MNPKSLIASIERNRAVMEAGFQRLSGLAPDFSGLPQEADPATLLAHAARAHLAGAAGALRELARSEADTRRAFPAASAESGPVVLDGEAVIIETRETDIP
jgi:hypothetical protein